MTVKKAKSSQPVVNRVFMMMGSQSQWQHVREGAFTENSHQRSRLFTHISPKLPLQSLTTSAKNGTQQPPPVTADSSTANATVRAPPTNFLDISRLETYAAMFTEGNGRQRPLPDSEIKS